MNKKIFLIFFLILFIFFGNVFAVDVPVHRQDLGFSGSTTDLLPPPIQTIWRETVGATKSYPILIGEKLYIGTTWALICYNANWGTKIWQYYSKDFINSSPVFYNDRIYCGSTNNMYCVDAKTGILKWKFNTGNNSTNASPIVFSDILLFGSNNSLIALSTKNGSQLWKILFANNVTHPVAVVNDKFFVASGDRIYGFNLKTHTKLWEFQLQDVVENCFSASKDALYVTCKDSIYAINITNGKLKWKNIFDAESMNPTSFYNNNVYAGFDQFLYCLNADNGKVVWQFEAGYYIESAPCISDKYIWIGADDFNIYCIDRLTGEKLYESITGSTSYYVVIGNNRIFSLSIYGELYSYIPIAKKEKVNVVFELWIGKKYVRKNGKFMNIDAPPFIDKGRTLLPIRVIGDAIDADVRWYPESKKITYALGTKFIELWVGNLSAYISGKPAKLEVAPMIQANRSFIPLRFVSENFGARIKWEPNEKKITLEYP
jgi:outer membrane protein assembly factor BamB